MGTVNDKTTVLILFDALEEVMPKTEIERTPAERDKAQRVTRAIDELIMALNDERSDPADSYHTKLGWADVEWREGNVFVRLRSFRA